MSSRDRGRARPAPGRPPSARRAAPAAGSGAGDALGAALSAAVAAGLVALIGVALSLIVTVGSWSLAPHTADTGPDTASRVAVALWLYTHHVPLEVGGFTLGLVPLGLVLIPGALTYAGGRQVARATHPQHLAEVGRAVIPYALVYGVLAAIAAGLVRSEEVQPAPLRAFVAASLVAAVAGTLGVVHSAGLWPRVRGAVPGQVRDVIKGGVVALATVVTVSAVMTALALAVGFPDGVEMFRVLDPGWAGAPALLVMAVAFIPNLVVWTASVATGVGFSLGVDGSVGPQGVEYGPLPVFPPLAAVPPEGDPGVWAYLMLLAPLLGGYAAGSLAARGGTDGRRVEHLALRAAAAGGLAGIALGILAALAAGSAGNEALAQVGPVGWQVGLVAGLEMALVAAVVAWELDRRGGPSLPRLIDLRDKTVVPAKLKAVLRRR